MRPPQLGFEAEAGVSLRDASGGPCSAEKSVCRGGLELTVAPCVLSEDGEHMPGGPGILDDAWLPKVVHWPTTVIGMYMGSASCLDGDV